MNLVIGSDGKNALTDTVIEFLAGAGHHITLRGALVNSKELWPKVAYELSEEVANKVFDQGILFCWTGTGVSIAANKVRGVRAALCGDAETARGARRWNDANILVLSLRATTPAIGKEILEAWFSTLPSTDPEDVACFDYLKEIGG